MNALPGIIVALPLLGFLINGLLGKKINSERASGLIGSLSVGFAFLAACAVFIDMAGSPVEGRSRVLQLYTWVAAGRLSVNIAYQVDQLSILMTLIVTGVGFLIHVYSIGYMRSDRGFWRFFAYLNLFIFMMLNLVLANNFLLMFLGWEGVGLCSYLLIGFWHERKFDTGGYREGEATTSDAAKKAFIVNRVGDFAFLIGMFLIFSTFGSLSFDDVFARAAAGVTTGDRTMVWITLLLFIGATGKSAQIPLYVWLPDAMAGPTPVSALIHAATMVTAGVYMVARCSILYALAPVSMQVVAGVGLATALMAASLGVVQNDIKKILAYSTISQLGYMFLALGVGAFASGVFHVMTHAFFKALLFLGAGAVIHAMGGEQDIQHMGSLKGSMPKTSRTFLIAALAIAGIPPLSGFFSKDEILFRAFTNGSPYLWLIGWFTAALTAFYMFRLYFLTFEGAPRWEHGKHPHEAPPVMTVPLVILAILSAIGGFLGIPRSLGGTNAIEAWLEPVFERANAHLAAGREVTPLGEYALMAASLVVAAAGIYFARRIYRERREVADRIRSSLAGIYNLLWKKYFVDEIYDRAIVAPTVALSEKLLWKAVDVGVIDGIVNGTAHLMGRLSGVLRRLHSGVVQSYAFAFVIGIIVILGILIFR